MCRKIHTNPSPLLQLIFLRGTDLDRQSIRFGVKFDWPFVEWRPGHAPALPRFRTEGYCGFIAWSNHHCVRCILRSYHSTFSNRREDLVLNFSRSSVPLIIRIGFIFFGFNSCTFLFALHAPLQNRTTVC